MVNVLLNVRTTNCKTFILRFESENQFSIILYVLTHNIHALGRTYSPFCKHHSGSCSSGLKSSSTNPEALLAAICFCNHYSEGMKPFEKFVI